MSHSALLHDVGEALYGPLWQSPLARDLAVSARTVRRWAAGSDDMPAGVLSDLWTLCDRRAKQILEAKRAIGAARFNLGGPSHDR